jgi:hypothetical protein
MDKEELLLRYECEGGEDLYAEAKPKFEAALAATPGDARLLNNYGYPGISMHYSAAFVLERLGRLAEAAGEWRFIIGWCEGHDALIEATWPRQMLQRIEADLCAR